MQSQAGKRLSISGLHCIRNIGDRLKRIYEARKGQWHIKGYLGYSPTKQRALQRLKSTRKRTSIARVFYKVEKEEAQKYGGVYAIAGRIFEGSYMKGLKSTVNSYFRKREKLREAIIRGKQQKKLSMFI